MNDTDTATNKKVKASQHESYGTFTILSIIIPIVGFILGIVYLAKDKKVDKKLGEHLVAVSVLFGIFWSVLLTVFVFKSSNLTTVPVVTTTSLPSSSQSAPAPTTAHVGSAIKIGDTGLTVTVQQVIDPASTGNQYIAADAGKRFVAIKLQIVNNSGSSYSDDALNDVSVVGTDNQNAAVSPYPITQCTNFNNGQYTLAVGESATGCVNFQLPNGVQPAKVKFTSSQGSGSTGEWLVP